MYWEIAGTDERVRAIPGVRDRRVRATKVRLYMNSEGSDQPVQTDSLVSAFTDCTHKGVTSNEAQTKVYTIMSSILFVWFDSLHPINNLSDIKGRVFVDWTSTKLGLMFLLKDKTQWRWWGSNPRPLGLESSTLPLSHCAPSIMSSILLSMQV